MGRKPSFVEHLNVPGVVLGMYIIHLIHAAVQRSGGYHPHFAEEEAEHQRG